MYTVSLLDYNSSPTGVTPTPSKEELYIYDPRTYDEGLIITDPVLSLTASQAGSFTCKLPITNYGHNKIIKKLTRLVVRKDNKIIFMGRINSDSKDLYLNDEIKAEGALAYLNDSLTGKRVFTPSNNESSTSSSLFDILSYIFTYHNSKFPNEPWKQFTLVTTGDIYGPNDERKAKFVGRNTTDVNSSEISYYSVNYFTSMESVSELLSLANAVLKIEYNESSGKWDVYIFKQYVLPKCSQTIEFGENLIDLVQSYDDTDICSSVAPFGGDAIQESNEIGDSVAGEGTNTILVNGEEVDRSSVEHPENYPVIAEWYPDAISVRDKDNPNGAYSRVSTSSGTGYWVFGIYIDNYNSAHPNNILKRIYVSWRGHYLEETIDNVVKCEDCAWRVYDSAGQTLGFKTFDTTLGFDSDVNECIDLTDAQFIGATHVVVSGWGNLITPLIRRDAPIVEENDKLDITKCDVIVPDEDEDSIGHDSNSPYLYSKSYINSFGLIEKKLEYDIEDTAPKLANWIIPVYPTESVTDYGKISKYADSYLGYYAGPNGDDYESYRGNYQIISLGSSGTGYDCIQYELPDLGNPKRPRGVYISSRMHTIGTVNNYMINGMYALYDTSWQPLMWKAADANNFTSIKDEYIDLSDPKCYGAKYIRVGGWGGYIPVNAVPSDDAYARNRLLDQARLYLTSQQWEKVTIEATAVDLSMTGSEWERFDICTLADVHSTIHGIASTLPITSLDIHLDDFEDNSIRLGYDSDEYLSAQLSENLRIMSIEQAIEEKRRENK